MKLYQYGLSLEAKIMGESCPFKTYVCSIPSAREYTLEQAMEMLNQEVLRLGEVLVNIDMNTLTITCENNNQYTLAHEYSFTSEGVVLKPSTIFRHASTQPFLHNTIYEENGSIVDITDRGVSNIANSILCPTDKQNFKVLSERYPSLLIDALVICHKTNKRMSDTISGRLSFFSPRKPIKDIRVIEELLKKDSTFFKTILNYKGFFNYLCEVHNLTFSVTFNYPSDINKRFDRFNNKPENRRDEANGYDVMLKKPDPGRRGVNPVAMEEE